MRGFKQRMWRYLPGAHPGIEQLILWTDGLLCPDLQSHMARCERCTRTSELLRAAANASTQSNEAGNRTLEPILRRVFCTLEEQMRSCRSVDTRRQHWMKALEFYFGKELVRHSSYAGMAPAGQTLLQAFLGRKAAEAITCQITGAAV